MPMYNDDGAAVNDRGLTPSSHNLPGGIRVRFTGRLRCDCGRVVMAYDPQVHSVEPDAEGTSNGTKDISLVCPGCHQYAGSIEVEA